MSGNPGETAGRRERRRQAWVMLGLLVTFVGIGSLWLALPINSGDLTRGIPYAALGAVGLWVGGILLGVSGRGRRVGSRGS